MSTTQVVQEVELLIEESVMLGAAWECLSEEARAKFRRRIEKLISDALVS